MTVTHGKRCLGLLLFSDMWRAKTLLRLDSSYLDVGVVTWRPGQADGLSLRPSGGDGVWSSLALPDGKAVVSRPNPHSQMSRYLYFDVDSAFAYGLYDQAAKVSVTYRDGGCASFCLEYDNTDPVEGVNEGAFRRVGDVAVKGTQSWKTAEFVLPQCRFMNRCNNADFRFVILGGDLDLAIRKVIVKRVETTGGKQ